MQNENIAPDQTAEPTPTLLSSLRRLFADAAVHELVGQYRAAVHAGARDDPRVLRTAGASFNPRPARVASLAMHEGGSRSVALIAAAFWFYAPLACPRAEIRELVDAAWDFKRGVLNPRADVQTLAAAAQLDRARHAHMCENSRAEINDQFARCRDLCERLTSLEVNRLRAMIDAYCARWQRHDFTCQ